MGHFFLNSFFRFQSSSVIVLNKLRSNISTTFTNIPNSNLSKWQTVNLHVSTPHSSWPTMMLPSLVKKIQTILKAAGVDVEPYWPGLFAKALESCNVKDLITNVGSGVGAAPAAGGAAPAAGGAAAAEEKKEEKKEEPEEESDDDMGFGLFD